MNYSQNYAICIVMVTKGNVAPKWGISDCSIRVYQPLTTLWIYWMTALCERTLFQFFSIPQTSAWWHTTIINVCTQPIRSLVCVVQVNYIGGSSDTQKNLVSTVNVQWRSYLSPHESFQPGSILIFKSVYELFSSLRIKVIIITTHVIKAALENCYPTNMTMF